MFKHNRLNLTALKHLTDAGNAPALHECLVALAKGNLLAHMSFEGGTGEGVDALECEPFGGHAFLGVGAECDGNDPPTRTGNLLVSLALPNPASEEADHVPTMTVEGVREFDVDAVTAEVASLLGVAVSDLNNVWADAGPGGENWAWTLKVGEP